MGIPASSTPGAWPDIVRRCDGIHDISTKGYHMDSSTSNDNLQGWPVSECFLSQRHIHVCVRVCVRACVCVCVCLRMLGYIELMHCTLSNASRPSQQWVYDVKSGQMKNPYSQLCMDPGKVSSTGRVGGGSCTFLSSLWEHRLRYLLPSTFRFPPLSIIILLVLSAYVSFHSFVRRSFLSRVAESE